MVEINKISNPLTIIGIFAGVAELAGTTVLPFILPELQIIFIWYVIGFPILLVVTFFLTLNFNNKALYAPSDFSNEDNFMRLLDIAKVDKKIEITKVNNPDIVTQLEDIQLSLHDNVLAKDFQGYEKFYKAIQILDSESNGITASELAMRLGVTRTYAYKLLQKLQKDGIITSKDGIEKVGETSRKVKHYVISDIGRG